ncbi:kinase-like domain-containing protein [Jackrogersella minutella]|nr:kinase-like domain-containing protein [Jackrogersella minutella]
MASSPYPAPAGARGVLNSSEPLPVTPQEITAEWATKVLGQKVKTVTIVKEIHSTASKILVDLTYEGNADADNKPTQVCIKGGFNKALMALHPSLLWTYRREAEFYFYISPIVNMNLPKAWYCGTDTVAGQGLVVMSNLSAQGCDFGEPLKPWPVERVRAGVEELASFHAKTWGAAEEDFPWLAGDKSMGGNPLMGMISSLVSPEPWDVRFKQHAPPPLPKPIANRERIERAFKTMWATENPKLKCVIHGDAHVGNTFITADGRPGFIDWQAPHAGVNLQDVAYFVTGAMDIGERRKHEVDLVKHYLQALHESGGPKFEKDDIWHDYRKHSLHGLAWALTAPGMQSDENVFVMTERHAAAVADHETMELLESLPEYSQQ